MRRSVVAAAALFVVVAPQLLIGSQPHARVVSIAGLCLVLWLSEIVPPFVPTIILWTLIPLFLGPLDPGYRLPNVLRWAIDPVMALFFGGFVLGVATQRSGFDKRLTRLVLNASANSFRRFLVLIIALTAFLSMWMSNIAAAVLILACMRQVLAGLDDDDILRRTSLIGVAIGADLGGIATPVGTGPNAIAIASLSATQPISFIEWMIFAFPLTIGMLALAVGMLFWRLRGNTSSGTFMESYLKYLGINSENSENSDPVNFRFLGIFIGTILLWLTEPIHGIPAAVTALASAALIFVLKCLSKEDIRKIDWSTLILISGGITLGRMLDHSRIVAEFADNIALSSFDPTLALFLLCLTSALLAALMSNTATAVLLIPLATALIASPSTAILIAISASFGIPFIISTPPNAIAFGYGGLRFTDLFWPGIVLMIAGCLLVSLTGPSVLKFVGVG